MGKNDGLRLYVGRQTYGSLYYINTRGESYINKHAITFETIDALLRHLKENYKKRKAMLVAVDNNIRDEEKERVLETIKKNNLKIKISKSLEDRFS